MSEGHSNGIAGAMITAAPLAKTAPVEATRTFEPNGIDEAYRLAKILVASRLLPDGANTPEAAFAIIATGRELGLTAMQSLRSIHVIKGKPTLSADLVCALVKARRDVCLYFRLVESTDQVARYETHRVGEPSPTPMTFTIEDAKRAQVTGNPNWTKYPAAMLRARCITALARAVYPDLAMGLYDPDELEAPAMAPPQAYEVVQPAAPVEPKPDVMARIASATTPAELNTIARAVQKANNDGHLSDSERDIIAAAVKARRAVFAPLPEPPASEPKVDPKGEVAA